MSSDALIGIFILVIIALGIINLRNKISNSNYTVLKNCSKSKRFYCKG